MANDILRKRLLYKSCHRGWKEMDILLGEFTKKYIQEMSEVQLEDLDILLDEPDVELFNWVTKKASVPEKYNNEVMLRLQEFKL
jgi:succinate dehydrogenase flavin-adding protein (antitoxin of CptAB toxin-antitoxin module)